MKRWIRRIGILAALVATVVLLRLTVFRPAPVPVTVYAVDRGRVESTVVNSRAGTVRSRNEAQLSPGLSGVIAEIRAEKGSHVKKGDLLLRLDDAEYRAQVLLSERALDAARSSEREACLTAELAERELARTKSLFAKGFVSDSGIEKAQTERDVTAAACAAATERVKQAAAALAAARATLGKTVLAAPFDGVVADVRAEEGEWISPSMPGLMIPPVIDIVDPNHLYVQAPLDEVDAARIAVGLPARITMDAFPERTFLGAVSWIAPKIDAREEQNRVLPVECTFDAENDLRPVLPGLSADIEVILDARNDVLRIPSYALLLGDNVLVINSGKLTEQAVEIGLKNWSYAEVRSGLEPGQKVVVSLDRAEVRAGARAEIRDELTP